MQLLEWFANNYKNFGTNLQIVTDKSQEGSQFCKGFGGIGGKLNNAWVLLKNWILINRLKLLGLLRYRLDLQAHDFDDDIGNDINYDEDDY